MMTTSIAKQAIDALLARIKNKEPITAEERLTVIRQILGFSSRDWSMDSELWLLYQVAFNDGSDDDA